MVTAAPQATKRRVLATGAASGIGSSVADRLRANGDRVAGLDRDEAGLGRQELDIRVTCDVRDESPVAAAVGLAAEALGVLDVVVSATGVASRGTVGDLDTEGRNRAFRH